MMFSGLSQSPIRVDLTGKATSQFGEERVVRLQADRSSIISSSGSRARTMSSPISSTVVFVNISMRSWASMRSSMFLFERANGNVDRTGEAFDNAHLLAILGQPARDLARPLIRPSLFRSTVFQRPSISRSCIPATLQPDARPVRCRAQDASRSDGGCDQRDSA